MQVIQVIGIMAKAALNELGHDMGISVSEICFLLVVQTCGGPLVSHFAVIKMYSKIQAARHVVLSTLSSHSHAGVRPGRMRRA